MSSTTSHPSERSTLLGHARGSAVRDFNLKPLDGLRAVASLVVMSGHFIQGFAPKWDDSLPDGGVQEKSPVVGLEYLSPVTLFFVISGFTLTSIYDRVDDDLESSPSDPAHDKSPFPTRESVISFLKKRVARLLPIYILALILDLYPLLIHHTGSLYDFVESVVVTLLLLQSVVIKSPWDAPLWTISAFAICYAIFPFMLRRMRTYSTRTMIAAVLILNVINFGISCCLSIEWSQSLLVLHVSFAPRLVQFAAGIAACLISRRLGPEIRHATLITEFLTLFFVGFITLVLIRGTGNNNEYFRLSFGYEFLVAPLHALFLAVLTHPDAARGPTAMLLSSRPMKFLGDVSYALYCTHMPVFGMFTLAMFKGVMPVMHKLSEAVSGYFCFDVWMLGVAGPICVGAAALAFYGVEEPMRKYLNGR
ncbi:hypothetical protein HK101_001911 [Irineochytrium annulatum]|nr:hypothetical protein HK101_001911 [Irineochytrium annulatum]